MPDIFVAEEKPIADTSFPIKEADFEKSKPSPKKIEAATQELQPKKSEKHMGIFSTYCVEPTGITFSDQEKDEKILLFLRRHFITNLDWMIISVVLAAIPLLLAIINLFNPGFNMFALLTVPPHFIIFFLIFYYSAIFTFILVNLVSWFYNIGLVTTKRVVDIDLVELIFKNIATTQHSLIQDVSYSQNGALRALFNFGDVIVQTAGQEGKFELEAVPHPDKVVHLIEDFIGKRHKHGI